MRWPLVVATHNMELSGLHTTNRFSPEHEIILRTRSLLVDSPVTALFRSHKYQYPHRWSPHWLRIFCERWWGHRAWRTRWWCCPWWCSPSGSCLCWLRFWWGGLGCPGADSDCGAIPPGSTWWSLMMIVVETEHLLQSETMFTELTHITHSLSAAVLQSTLGHTVLWVTSARSSDHDTVSAPVTPSHQCSAVLEPGPDNYHDVVITIRWRREFCCVDLIVSSLLHQWLHIMSMNSELLHWRCLLYKVKNVIRE